MATKEEIEETTVRLGEQVQQQREQLLSQKESLEKKEEKIEVLEDVVAERKEEALRAVEANNAALIEKQHNAPPPESHVSVRKKDEEIIELSGKRGYTRPIDEEKAKDDMAADMQGANEASCGLYLTDGTQTEITFTDSAVTMKAGRYEVGISNDEEGNPIYHRSNMDHRGIIEESKMLTALAYHVTGLKDVVSVGYTMPQDNDGKSLGIQDIFSSNLSAAEKNKAFSQCTMAVAAVHMGKSITMDGEPFTATKPGFEHMSEGLIVMAQRADMRQELLQKGHSVLKPVPTASQPTAKQEVTPTAKPPQPTITKDVGQDIADSGTKSKKDAVMTQLLDKGRSGLKPTPVKEKTDDPKPTSQHEKAETATAKPQGLPVSPVVAEAREKAGGVDKLQRDASSQATKVAADQVHTAPKAGGSSS